jgi:hypothetical protein
LKEKGVERSAVVLSKKDGSPGLAISGRDCENARVERFN